MMNLGESEIQMALSIFFIWLFFVFTLFFNFLNEINLHRDIFRPWKQLLDPYNTLRGYQEDQSAIYMELCSGQNQYFHFE